MTKALEIQDVRNLIASVNLTKALVRKFEERPFTVGSANSSVKMFSSLITLLEPPFNKLSTRTQTIAAKGFGKRVKLSKLNSNFSEAFVNVNEEEVVPAKLVEDMLDSYKDLLESIQVVVAMASETHIDKITSLTERELTIIDECREVYNKFMENYEDENEAFHNYEHKQDIQVNSTTMEKELALIKNTEVNLEVSTDNGDDSKPHISADFRLKD